VCVGAGGGGTFAPEPSQQKSLDKGYIGPSGF
jgi:hypothetical protein